MSSPAPSIQSFQSGSTRNPRRRQRNPAEDGSMRQQPQRKRTKLTSDSFKPISVEDTNGTVHSKSNGHKIGDHIEDAALSQAALNLPVRGGKQLTSPSKRGAKDDGSISLTKNPVYTVKQLPALPENIRSNRRDQLRADFSPSNGYALALTHTQALVWDYTSRASTPPTRIFSLPNPARYNDPIPIGSLVPGGSSGDTGLVVINATTGRITFWESVEDADSLSLFEQRRNGVVGSCGSLLSDEKVTAIENAEHAGFVLTFSTGRVAQLLLRDAQSRSLITVNFLRNQAATSTGGLLGGLKNVFTGASWVKGMTAARAHRSQIRGNMELIVTTDNALFQIWQITWSGQTLLQSEVDGKAAVISAATSAIPDARDQTRTVKLIDFAIASDMTTKANSLVSSTSTDIGNGFIDLLVLVQVSDANTTIYALIELEITKHVVTARRTILLYSYTAPVIPDSKWKPRIVMSHASEIAFVVFEKAIVLVSLVTVKSSPNSQLLIDAHRLPEPFQDTVHLQSEGEYAVVGMVVEDHGFIASQPSINLFIEKFGVIRITTTEYGGNDQVLEQLEISAKSKLEQAVFFGTMNGNPLDLSLRAGSNFSIDEIEEAALAISREICATDPQSLSAVAPSMDHHLEQRAQLLKQLVLKVKQYPGISRITRWRLRFDAEKMAGARKVWCLYDKQVNNEDLEERLLPQLLVLLQSSYKTPVETDQGERDHVRQWFLKDVWRMENIVAWPWRAIIHLETEKEIRDYNALLELLSDACDIVLGSLGTAFTFRQDSATLYGLDDEILVDGVLQQDYQDLPEFWTSTYAVQKIFPAFIKGVTDRLFQATENNDEQLVEKIAENIPKLVDIYCRSAEERYRWHAAQDSEKERIVGEEFKTIYEQERSNMIQTLPDIGLTTRGMDLAERYKDMQALVYLVNCLAETELDAPTQRRKAERREQVAGLEKRIRRYFDTYGDEWANAFYSSLVSRGAYTTLLGQSDTYKVDVARFLRAQPGRHKVGWINDVLSEGNYLTASETLSKIADTQEIDLWSKKVELSLAKLALVADKVQGHSIQDPSSPGMGDGLQLVKLQERLYEHVRPTLYNAVDQTAELQLAMEAFGKGVGKGRPALHQLLERGMENLIKQSAMDPEQLIDVFTLMDQKHSELKHNDIAGDGFSLALKVVLHSGFGQQLSRQGLLLKLIFKRCFLCDDWKTFDAAARRSDQEAMDALESTTLFKTIYEGYANGLWNETSKIRLLPPSEVLGAGTSPDDYRDRFSSADIRVPIAKDVSSEDEKLKQLISKCRLTHWFTITDDWAKERVRRETESHAEHARRLQQVVTDLQGDDEDLEKYKGVGSMPEM